jgi:hypothetical protein
MLIFSRYKSYFKVLKIVSILSVVFLCLLRFSALGQNDALSTIRIQVLSTSAEQLQLDSLSMVPGSLIVAGIDTSDYSIDYFQSKLIWKNKPSIDSIQVSYRVFPFFLPVKYFHKNPKAIEQNILITPFYYNATDAQNSNQPFIDFGKVDYAGSFGRNLSFGNSQDVVLNSQFNLQLDGDLGDSIKLTGAITDNTIPFQPEGNTQQLQEFDRVFLQLKRKKATIAVGDYDIKKPAGYFMNFYKRVQGGLFSSGFKTGKNGENSFMIGASLAKGKFVRNVITALEGNQGPYKLIGPNGEQFFVVLAGTERVYIDGVIQSRGEGQDYIIDYNTAEVTFMPRRLITKDLRITVEFEFSDRNYLNSLFYVNDVWQVNEKLQLRFNAYSNQDAKNQPIQLSLDSAQKTFLSSIGDSIQFALYPSARFQDTFSNNKILYKKIDTFVNGTLHPNIFVFSTNPDSAKYSLAFTNVGFGTGNYIQSISTANGRVYEWIAPVNGIRQGDYEPVSVLVTPKKQQLFTAGATYQIDSNKVISVEAALSNYDPNTFSRLHNNTHNGVATKLNYAETRPIRNNKDVSLSTTVNYEFVQDRFKPLERFRNVEFARDWNITQQEKQEHEHLGNVQLTLQKNELGKLDYRFGSYLRGSSFKGFQHVASIAGSKKGYRLLLRGDYMQQASQLTQSDFVRPYLEFEKILSSKQLLTLGTRYLVEHNALKDGLKDTLLQTAFSFDALSVYLKNDPNHTNHFNAEYTLRHDRAAKNNVFKQSTEGHTFSLNTSITSIKNHDLKLTGAYRILSISDSTITILKPDESLLGRLDYNFTLFKGLISGNALYELGSGQELKREFTYVQVPAGQGMYVWRDYNGDNLKQLNEFELAIFPDEKLYIKLFTPTNQYIKAKYSVYNQSISLNPKSLLNQSKLKGIRKVISILNVQSAIQLNNRFVGKQGISQYNPFIQKFEDSLLINNSSSIINSFFINRFSAKWGVDYIQTLNGGKTLLNYGVDSRRNTEDQLRGRYNLSRYFTLQLAARQGRKTFRSQFLETRSYAIRYKLLEPGMTLLLLKNQFRIQSSYKYDIRKNAVQFGGEEAVFNSISMDLKYNFLSAGALNTRFTFSDIVFNGISNSTIGYTMLDGLQNGKNYLWGASFDKRLSRNIEMSLEYEGRKPASNPVIHTGRASVRAVF